MALLKCLMIGKMFKKFSIPPPPDIIQQGGVVLLEKRKKAACQILKIIRLVYLPFRLGKNFLSKSSKNGQKS